MPARRGGALGATALGVGLFLAAGLFDAEPLYVPAIVLVVLGLVSGLWVRLAARGTHVERRLSAVRVQEDEPLLVEVDVVSGAVAPPAGELRDPLLSAPARLTAARRHTRVRIRARFSRRGRRLLAPPDVLIRDPLGLCERLVTGTGPPDEVLVLPRVAPVLSAPGARGHGATGRTGPQARAGADADLAGLRAHRPGTPASRIAWPVYSRTGEMHERVLEDAGDTRPVIVLDLRAAGRESDVDAAVRAAASLTVHLAERGGCALLLPGDRRPVAVEPGLRAWPHLHARLALVRGGEAALPGALAGSRGTIIWVSGRPRREVPALPGGSGPPILVVPDRIPGRRAAFAVAGCSGYSARVLTPGPAAPAASGAAG